MSTISCKGLARSYGDVRALDGVDLAVESGEICALLGPSGCGKTTALRLIAGFERPDAGTVVVGGRTLSGSGVFVPPERRRIGMVFQDYALFPHYDVGANVAYGLKRDAPAERVAEVLELVGLHGVAHRYPHELSGGQQQRVALARALAPTPDVILLDEPFSNLDATLRVRVRQETREILLAADTTSLFVTHDQEEALSLADTVAVMHAGRIEQVGTPEEVYGRPSTHWVAEFLLRADVIPGTASNGYVQCELARLAIDPGFSGSADVLIRPESVSIGVRPAAGDREEHEGVVVAREFYGHDQLVQVELSSGRRLRSHCSGFPAWHPGDRVRVWLDGPVNVLPSQRPAQDGGRSGSAQ